MNNKTMKKCTECNKEITTIYSYKCTECEKKENRRMYIILSLILLFTVSIIIGVRIFWAKVVYKDARCAFAECRISVDPK